MNKIIPIKPNMTSGQKECLIATIEKIQKLDVESFFIVVETKDPEDKYIQSYSNVSPGLLGVLEISRQALIRETFFED